MMLMAGVASVSLQIGIIRSLKYIFDTIRAYDLTEQNGST